MTSIIVRTTSDGMRRCDATCHKAKGGKCACICGGLYHGIGSSEEARRLLTENARGGGYGEQAAELLAQAEAQAGS